MTRPAAKILTDGELKIMQVLWRLGQGSVRQVTEVMQASQAVAFNTVQTMLRILEAKGYVSHRKQGKAFVYQATVSRSRARSQALSHLVGRFFDGSPQALVQNLIADRQLDAIDIEALKGLLEQPEPGPSSADEGEVP